MNPEEYRKKFARVTPTGTKRKESDYVGHIEIICLDEYERLPMNWAIAHRGYHEFRTLAAARKFARSL
jgi:hypothetical protein